MQKIIVASSKGGVGKSTVALGVAVALSSLGKTVLLCDADLENRCLDLFMGVEDALLFNAADVACGRVSPRDATLSDGAGFHFLAAPSAEDAAGLLEDGGAAFTSALRRAAEEADVDYAIFDTGTAHGVPEMLAREFPDAKALVVASHQATSMRGAERTAKILEASGVSESRLVICGYDMKSASKNERSGLIKIIDTSRVPLIGVIPYDRALMLCHERGVKVPSDAPSATAFKNVAKRITGERVRLFDGIGSIKRKKII